jgi:hypothetical protein
MEETYEEKENVTLKKSTVWKLSTLVLGVLLIASVWTGGFKMGDSVTGSVPANTDGLKVIILNDERCVECDSTGLIAQLKNLFVNLEVEEIDYSSKEGQNLYSGNNIQYLPAVLFTDDVKNDASYSNIASFLDVQGDYLSLKIGAEFDPDAEICDNDKDDDEDGQVDCLDSDCSSEWKCMEKKAKPSVEVFVMSHCPFGTQIEKGILPVVDLLGDKIDFELKFCDYAMHDKKEIDEQLAQYCIQEEQNGKFLDYLNCFLEDGDSDRCISEIGIDKEKLSFCIDATDKQFKISESYADKSTWKGSFPSFDLFKSDNLKYGVQGSPTLVINGVQARTGRDSASLLDAVCTGFKDEPSECSESLSSANPSSGFGFGTTANTAASTCG